MINHPQKYLKEKIDQLNLAAWTNRVTDSNKAHLLSKEAIEYSRSISYEKGLAEGLRTHGFCLIRLSRHKEAEAVLEESLALYKSIGEESNCSPIYEYIGIINRAQGKLEVSLKSIYKALELSQVIEDVENEITHYYQLGVTYRSLGNYEKCLDHLFKCLSLSRSNGHPITEGYSINVIGSVFYEIEDYVKAQQYFQEGWQIRKKLGDKWGEAGSLDNIGKTFSKLGDWEKAISYCEQSLEINKTIGNKNGQANALLHIAEAYKETGDFQLAERYGKESLQIRQSVGERKGEAEALLFLGKLMLTNYNPSTKKQLLQLLLKALSIAKEVKSTNLLSKIHYVLYKQYNITEDYKTALTHLESHYDLEKQLHKDAVDQKIVNIEITHRIEESKKEAEIFRLRNVELAGLYEESKKQKEEIELQKRQVEATLEELKTTQAQLIQSEKMASLGELTAGIAHEIQNPLNFVNNFSQISNELLEEMKEEMIEGNTEEVAEIISMLSQNIEKIHHHGERASGIVKGMLQHSRANKGEKESTDINALCEEYLRLAYHGVRAKDKSFNVEMKTSFDESIGKINVLPQDIGRVILNLITNAFYAVGERSKEGAENFKPFVTVCTRKEDGAVNIEVKDNGTGIPKDKIDKIFQPFFTTKPTGQGTGLGLSLSYDIVKAHGGNLEVESVFGNYTIFTVFLPIIN